MNPVSLTAANGAEAVLRLLINYETAYPQSFDFQRARQYSANSNMAALVDTGINRQGPAAHLEVDPLQVRKGSKELGKGAFGVVYDGTLTGKDGKVETVAIKTIMNQATDPEQRRVILREITLWGAIGHANVLSLKAYTLQPCQMITELGTADMFNFLYRPPRLRLPLPEFYAWGLYFLLDVARGLQSVHRAHVIHGDLKVSFGLTRQFRLLLTPPRFPARQHYDRRQCCEDYRLWTRSLPKRPRRLHDGDGLQRSDYTLSAARGAQGID
jgi:hypothetical protein